MARKSRNMLVVLAAFAASPQGRRLLQQAKEYASRPENRQRAAQLLSQARAGGKGGSGPTSTAPGSGSDGPSYGSPPKH
jgi:hypothetical protein